MIDTRLAWFAIGALCGAVLFGWPWHPRFSRYERRGSNPPPYSSAAIAWQAEAEASRAKFIDPSMGELWKEGRTQRGHGSGGPTTPKPSAILTAQPAKAPDPYWQRSYINNPVQIAECGGPCQQGPEHCNCGALQKDTYISSPLPYPTTPKPPKPQPPPCRIIDQYGMTIGYRPLPWAGPTTPPPREP